MDDTTSFVLTDLIRSIFLNPLKQLNNQLLQLLYYNMETFKVNHYIMDQLIKAKYARFHGEATQ